MISAVQKYLIPGLVFQSVIIGGGYGTGREIAEFFLSHGALGGLLGMLVTAVVWAVILAIAFEFARITQAYDYRSFFKALLGPVWIAFEVVYLLIVVLVLSVLGSAAGEMLSDALGLPPFIGVVLLVAAIGLLAFFGSERIKQTLAVWSVLLYLVYAMILIITFSKFGGEITETLRQGEVTGRWALDGVRYAAYNLIALGAVLFVLPALASRREAVCSGVIAGLIGILPGVFVYLAMLSQHPGIGEAAVPLLSILDALGIMALFVVAQIVLFGTFVETGAGLIHAINERVAVTLEEKGRAFPALARTLLAITLLGVAIVLAAAVGIIDLIASGYGALSYAFIGLVVLPLITIGLYEIAVHKSPETSHEPG